MIRWLLTANRRLRELGILGMNQRNVACILDHNPRALFPIVDDKLRLDRLVRTLGVPTPPIHAEINSYAQLKQLEKHLAGLSDFVIKPNRGSAGRGVLVVTCRQNEGWVRHNGEFLSVAFLRQHLSDILSGMYSLGGRPDSAIVQYRVRLHEDFAAISYKGIPDVRVIVYRKIPAMAMLRLPTKESNGRANLHQGGIGTGVDLDTGITHHAVQRNRAVTLHPDTGLPVVGMRVPYWDQVLVMACRVAEVVGLGYVGVDIVVDKDRGPLLLEANARPGLAIQIANGRGLLPRLQEIDALLDRPTPRPLSMVRQVRRSSDSLAA
jgi:alpha-L-glutamate ligase-like protein